jgi:hypothetical protein
LRYQPTTASLFPERKGAGSRTILWIETSRFAAFLYLHENSQILSALIMVIFLLREVTMKELWTAQVHLLTPPAKFGDTKCCTNVVAWADSAEDFCAIITTIFARRNWSILSVRQCQQVAACTVMTEEHAEQAERARMEPGSCIFGTLQYYPSKPA